MSELHDSGRSPRRIPVGPVVLLVLAQSSQAVAIGGFALFLPLIRSDLGITFGQAGAIAAGATLVYACMQIPAGILVDRVGAKRLFLIGVAGTNVLTFPLAVLDDYETILATQAVAGVFRALLFVSGLVLVAALFPPDRIATALGVMVAAGFSSSVLLNLLGPLLVGPLGWRALFALFATGGLVVLVLCWRFVPEAGRATGPPVTWRETAALFRLPAMWAVGTVQYVRLAVALGYATWLPTFLVDERGCSLQTAGLIVAFSAALTAPSNLLGGYLSDRLGNPLLVIGGALAGLAVTNVLLVATTSLAATVVLVGLAGLLVQLYFGPLFAFPIGRLGRRLSGVSNGFGNCFANLGGFTSVYLLGAARDATGSFASGFAALTALCVVGLAATVGLGTVVTFPARSDHELLHTT
jgi:nitrate/nitrite transporter NarK